MNNGSICGGVCEEHGHSPLITGDPYLPTRRRVLFGGKGISPFEEALSWRQRLLSYYSFQPQPVGDLLLVLGIEHNPLILDHRRDDGFCGTLNVAHPAFVTFLAYTLYDEIHPMPCEPLLTYIYLGTLRPSSMSTNDDLVWTRWRRLGLGQDFRCPNRDDVLPADFSLAAEDATSGHCWCTFSDERHTVESAETEDPKGRRNPVPERGDFAGLDLRMR